MSGTSTVTLTLNQVVTVAASDIIVRTGSYNNDIQGLLTTLDGGTSTIYGVNRSTYPIFTGNVVSGSSGQLTLNLMQQAYNEAARRGGAKINAIFCDYDSERFYNKLLVADKRYVTTGAGKVMGDGTFSDKAKSYLEFAGVPVVPDKDVCGPRLFMLDVKTWKKYVLSELEWADETGSNMIAQVSTDAWEFRLRLFANVFCEKPVANSVVSSFISP